MSSTLCWKKIHKVSKSLPDHLKTILQDCELLGDMQSVIINYECLDFLKGLSAAGVEGAEDLIEAVEKNDRIELYLEY